MYEQKTGDVFEGIEKRVNVQLKKNFFEDKKIKSLLEISDETWSKKLNFVGCNIISKISEHNDINEETCKAYLLSESSLFVYEDKLFLKTCGKTKVLFFIPILIDLLLKEVVGTEVLPEDCLYDETLIQKYDLKNLVDYANNSLEYVLFTHLNYQNCTEKNLFNQEYPHRSVKEEKDFFSFFFPNIQYVETPLSLEKTHYVFYSRLNHSFPSISQTFCSELVLFQIRNEQEEKKLREFYLNENVLNLFHAKRKCLHSDQEDLKTEDYSCEYVGRKSRREQSFKEEDNSFDGENRSVDYINVEESYTKEIAMQELVEMEPIQNSTTSTSASTTTTTSTTVSTTASTTASTASKIIKKKFCRNPICFENGSNVIDPMENTLLTCYYKDGYSEEVELLIKQESSNVYITQSENNVFKYSQENRGSYLYNEFHFTPCGYSCNIVNKDDYLCVHYSPEDCVSYVSVEFKKNISMKSFVKFMTQQLSFYQGKYLYILNYENACENVYANSTLMQHSNNNIEEGNSEEKSSNGGSESDVTKIYSDSNSSDSNQFMNEMNQSFVVNENLYYRLCTYRERIIDFMKIKYFVYECKNKSELHVPSTLDNSFCKISKTLHTKNDYQYYEEFRKKCYEIALDFCTNQKVHICEQVNKTEVWKETEKNRKNVELLSTNQKEVDMKKLEEKQNQQKNQHEIHMFHKILHENIETSMMCINLEKILRQYVRFKKNFPNVTPFYSMKSNNDATIIKLLYELGCNFDCASVGEIKKLLKILPWLPSERIIFANTIKSVNSLIFAKSKNVNLVTFDNIDELKKIAAHHSKCNLILRINVDFKNRKSYMSNKYGAYKHEWRTLLKYAKSENLKVIGVSFHVGSNTKHLEYYCEAIRLSKEAWDMAKTIGFEFQILNMGGGYPEELEYDHEHNLTGRYCKMSNEELRETIESLLTETTEVKNENLEEKSLSSLGVEFTFEQIAVAINISIDSFFKEEKEKMRIICEPGRFLVASSTILAVKVIGKRNPMIYEGNELLENEIDMTSDDSSNTYGEKKGSSINELKVEGKEHIVDSVHFFNEANKKLGNITNIKKEIVNVKNHRNRYYSYYVNESIYGCFSNIIFDEYRRTPFCIIRANHKHHEDEIKEVHKRGFSNSSNSNNTSTCVYRTSIFGQSCDGLDMINSQVYLPECDINDWLLYDYTGAYSYVSSSHFNGFRKSQKFYIFPPERF